MKQNHQPELINPELLPPRLRWQELFALLPPWPEQTYVKRGRNPLNRNALLKACIYQRLTGRRFLTDLCMHLEESPYILAAVGFDQYKPAPSVERFSSFLSDTEYTHFLWIFIDLVQQLFDEGAITATHVGFDSCPVPSWVKENNLKTGIHQSRFDKTKPPRGDPEARLGVRIHYPGAKKKKVTYFWGYRHHMLADLEAELPLWSFTEPCDIAETKLAVPLLEAPLITFGVKYSTVCGDAEYDSEHILRYIQDTLQAKAYVAVNPAHIADHNGFRRNGDKVFCPGDLQMYRKGKMTIKGITYIQYCCPFFNGPRPCELICPVDHPKFTKQKGCNYLWRSTDNPRDHIPYGTEEFKTHYNRRTAVERVFSRLLSISLQQPAVRGLRSIRNHCIISDIAVLLVALAAHRHGYRDKARYVKTLVPNIFSQNNRWF